LGEGLLLVFCDGMWEATLVFEFVEPGLWIGLIPQVPGMMVNANATVSNDLIAVMVYLKVCLSAQSGTNRL
jgi:hypothetical protein